MVAVEDVVTPAPLAQARASYRSWQKTVWACLQAPGCPPAVLTRALASLDRARWQLVALEGKR